ncbi:MAG: hypothetical protein AAGI07_20200 [Bacteroidota bacterium]
MKQLIRLTVSDFKLIFRDPSLRIFLVMPVLIFLVVDLLVPYLIKQYEVVNEYVPYVLMSSVTQVSQMFGFIYGMVLIDEKDTQVAKIYGVLPISKKGYVLIRLIIPIFLSIGITWLLLITLPFYQLSLVDTLVLSTAIGLITAVYPLIVSILSKNKMEGMTWIKIINLLMIIPVVSYFLPENFSLFFGVFPSYWIFEALNQIIVEKAFIGFLVLGTIYLIVLLFITIRKFSKMHFV